MRKTRHRSNCTRCTFDSAVLPGPLIYRTMSLRSLARLFNRIQPAARSTQAVGSHQAASLSPQFDSTEPLNWRWSLNNWLQSWQESSWLAVPKKKISPHRRGMRNAGKYQRYIPVVARCKQCSKAFPIHQLARCKAENCPGRFTQAA